MLPISRRRIPIVPVLMATLLCAALFFGLQIVRIVDPEDVATIELSSRVFGATLRNDTNTEAIVQIRILCRDTVSICGWATVHDGQLQPQASLNLVAMVGGQVDYRLLDPSGHILGCIPLRYPADMSLKDTRNITVLVSKAVACPTDTS